MTTDTLTKIIIEGNTESGEVFRPSDWAERMCGILSTFEQRRMHYSPLLQPTIRNGCKCLILDPTLQQINLSSYETVLDFAKNNKLKIYQE